MSAERRRIIVIVAALAVFAAAGIFWLTRLVFGATTDARFEAGFGGPSPSASVPSLTPAPLLPGGQALPDDEPAVPATTDREPINTRSRTPSATRSPTRSPSAPVTSRSTAAPPVPKTRTVEVGGVTLNNRNPRTMCTVFNNKLGLPVTLDDIGVTGDLEINPVKCAGQSDIDGSACRNGKTLGAGKFCFVGVVPTSDVPKQYRGTVSVKVTGLCTSTGPAACKGLGEPPPSPLQRVRITWVEKGDEEVCHNVNEPDEQFPTDFC
jgi:hypothetical protein